MRLKSWLPLFSLCVLSSALCFCGATVLSGCSSERMVGEYACESRNRIEVIAAESHGYTRGYDLCSIERDVKESFGLSHPNSEEGRDLKCKSRR